MKLGTLIAGTAVVLFCGGLGVCVAQEAPAPSAAPKVAPAAKHHPKHNHRHHHGKSHETKEFTEQQLQEMQAQPPGK
jgi:hypothetical protein